MTEAKQAYIPAELTGNLFKNDKGENAMRPDYTGTCMIGGVEHRIAAWIKESSNGSKYMSMKFDPKEGGVAPVKRDAAPQVDQDIPF